MRTYTCETHGEYTSEGYPDHVTNVCCYRCIQARDATAGPARDAYHAEYSAWLLWKHCGIPRRGQNRSMENWIPTSAAQQGAHKLLKQYAVRIQEHTKNGAGVTLYGPPGVGKTHLLCGAVSHAARLRIGVGYSVWSDVLDRHKATFGKRDSDDQNLIDKLKTVPLLALDEIGVRSGSEFDQALLFDLIDTRYRNQRATLIATNLTADALDSIGERTADRLREMNIGVSIPGESKRQTAATDRALIDAPPAFPEPVAPVLPFKISRNGEMVDKPVSIEAPDLY